MEKTKELSTSQPASMPARQESFGGVTISQQAELAGISVAAAARAEVESAYVLALRNPRNEEEGRASILKVCKNLKFSETAIYRKPHRDLNLAYIVIVDRFTCRTYSERT